MKSASSKLRTGVALAAVLVAIVVVLGLSDRIQNAQEVFRVGELPAKFAVGDDVTNDIRDPNMSLLRVVVNNDADRVAAVIMGRIVGDYGSFVTVSAARGTSPGRSKLETQTFETTVNLPNGRFDPLVARPSGSVRPDPETVPHSGYYIVQFGTTASDELLESLDAAGVDVLQYVPHQAFFVYGSGEAILKAAQHSRVRWVGRYLPEQKISPVLDEQLNAARGNAIPLKGISPLEMTGPDTSIFDVAVFKRANAAGIADSVSGSFGGKVLNVIDLPNNYFNVIRVEMPLDRVKDLASTEGVITIDFWTRPQKEDERAAQIVAGNYTNATTIFTPGYNPLSQFGADGTNVTVSMVDDGVSIPGNGGFYITAANTVNGPLRGAAAGATGGHGHINASIIAGNLPFGVLDPTGYNYGLGIAPKSNIINVPMLVGEYTGTEANAINDTVVTPGPNGVNGSISNNSWGNGTNSNVYDSYTAQFDGFVRDASAVASIDPVTLVFSAGNSGPGALSLTRPKAAKNLIATGNSENLRTEFGFASADNMDDLRSSSSRGPAADGRVKPDITAPGSYITGSRAGTCLSVSSCFDPNHDYSIGTSHAAPQVAGAAALFTQYWKNANSGTNPSPALIKAAIINTAREMNGVSTGAAIPNGDEGWGRINMKFMLNTGVAMKYVDQTTAFTDPGNNSTITGTVADATKPIRVSLVWTDPPGAANANPALVNNLDLSVTIGGNTYKGNVFTAGASSTGGSADTINNVENVWLPAGTAAGTSFSITVSATAINGDGILGNADATDQHFALVAYNLTQQPASAKAFDFDGDNKTDLSIFRPGPGEWWYLKSSNGGNGAAQFGTTTDKIVPGDYSGDGKTDMAFFRPATGFWYVLRSEDFSFYAIPFGTGTDTPAPADYDGDGKADPAVYRPSTSTWYINRSTGGTTIATFGAAGDVPVTADYDGDGKSDVAIFRPSLAQWWIQRSTAGLVAFQFGAAGDKTVAGDYTGDGKADAAFWRPSTGEWYVLRSENSTYYAVPFGNSTDVPSPGDYDGDGRFDAAVFRPSTSTWYINKSTGGTTITTFGSAGDMPVPSAYVR